MTIGVMIYHNPRCTKSRETLNLLKDKGVEPLSVVEYLNHTPGVFELKNILKFMGNPPVRSIMRTNETVYKDLNLADESLSDMDLLKAIKANPILLQRPIVVKGQKAAIGRPPEDVLSIL